MTTSKAALHLAPWEWPDPGHFLARAQVPGALGGLWGSQAKNGGVRGGPQRGFFVAWFSFFWSGGKKTPKTY